MKENSIREPNRTITLENRDEEGKYILYSGEERERKYGFFGYSDKMHFPFKRLTIPKTYVRFNEENNSLRFIFEYNFENNTNSIFGVSFKKKGGKFGPALYGSKLNSIYKVSQIMDKANKIPCEPSFIGGGILGETIPSGVKINEEPYFNYLLIRGPNEKFNEILEWKTNIFGDNYPINYKKIFHKKTKISKKQLKKIDSSLPLDDNGQEIKESDLVKLILK